MGSYFKSGAWNVVCDVCGREYKSDAVRKRWDGLIVCKQDYEPRHIADFLRVRETTLAVPFTRPEPADTFILVCPYPTALALADIGTADCARADISGPIRGTLV